MVLEFSNPPINEVVIGTYFNAPFSAFRSEHLGLLWTKFRSEFPTVTQQPPLMTLQAQNLQTPPEEVFPMPRYWFISGDETYLIQVQKNAFIFNWRRRDENAYPGYDRALKPSFDKYYDIFEEFIRTELGSAKPAIDQCELTYINAIGSVEYWSGPEDTSKVIPSFTVPTFLEDQAHLKATNCEYSYEVDPNTHLHLVVRVVPRPQQPDVSGLVLEIGMRGPQAEGTKAEADLWFRAAHDLIGQCFMAVTSRDIQETYWNLRSEK